MIVACPNCGAKYREETVHDLCVEVVREYTDGRCYTIPATSENLLMYCSACQATSKIEDAREVGQNDTTSWLYRPFMRRLRTPPALKYLEAIQAGQAVSSEQEFLFRVAAWRLSNDPFRDLPDSRKPLPKDRPSWWRENLRCFQALADSEQGSIGVLLAEVSRELGHFGECLQRVAVCKTTAFGRSEPHVIKPDSVVIERDMLDLIETLAIENNPFVQRLRTSRRRRQQ